MKFIVKIIAILYLSTFANVFVKTTINAQIFKVDIKKASQTIQKGIEQKTKQSVRTITNTPVRTIQKSNILKIENSRLNNNTLFQFKKPPILKEGFVRHALAGNLFVDIIGKYPEGYAPSWNVFSRRATIAFQLDNYVAKYFGSGIDKRDIMIGNFNGKATMAFGAFINCDCIADIEIDNYAVLTNEPQSFKITNFRKFENGSPTGDCISSMNNYHTAGGYEGVISLWANEDGDISMNLMLENYRQRNQIGITGVSYRYNTENFLIANDMSAAKAIAKVKSETEAKQRQKDYIAQITKQADSLQKVLTQKYPQKECRNCFERSNNSHLQTTPKSYVRVNQYGDIVGSGTDWDWDINTKINIRNVCNYNLTFVGIQQLYDQGKGYYLKEITKTMKKGYTYDSEQGLLGTFFVSLLGGGSEFNFDIQDKYNVNNASVGHIQWLKVIKEK